MTEPVGGLRVLGEDLPRGVAVGLLLVGALLAGGAVMLWQPADPRPQSGPATATAATATMTTNPALAPVPDTPAAARRSSDPSAAGTPRAATPDAGSDAQRLAAPGSIAQAPPTPRETATPAAPTSAPTADCAPVFSVLFRGGGSVPRGSIQAPAAQLAAWLRAHPDARLAIDGYSDQLGPVAERFAISQRRAQAVADELLRAGAARTQLQVRAFGHYVPGGEATASVRESRLVRLHVDGHPDCREPEEGRRLP